MNLENDLRRALRHESPEPGFANRVLARIEADLRSAPPPASRTRWWRAIAASVMLTAVLGGWAAHEIRERREGERAKQQVLLAMRIAGEKVRYAQEEVRSIGTND